MHRVADTHLGRPESDHRQAPGRDRDRLAVQRLDPAGHQVGLADEVGNETGARILVELVTRAHLFDAAMVHHCDSIGHDQGFLLVVGHVDEGHADAVLQILQLHLHVPAHLQIQRSERLVQQQHRRLQHERSGEGDALLLAPRKLARPAIAEGGQPDDLEHGADLPADVFPALAPLLEAEADVVEHGHVGKQRIVLKHHARFAAIGGAGAHHLAGDQHVAFGGMQEARDQPQRGRLPAAARSEQGQELPLLDPKVHVVDGHEIAEVLADVAEFDVVGCHRGALRGLTRRCIGSSKRGRHEAGASGCPARDLTPRPPKAFKLLDPRQASRPARSCPEHRWRRQRAVSRTAGTPPEDDRRTASGELDLKPQLVELLLGRRRHILQDDQLVLVRRLPMDTRAQWLRTSSIAMRDPGLVL